MHGSELVLDAAGGVPVGGSRVAEASPTGPVPRAADIMLGRLTSGMVPVASVTAGLCDIAHAARAATLGARQARISADDSARAVRASPSGVGNERIVARIRYDEFFSVRRVQGLRASEFRLGVLHTVARMCEDLQQTLIGLPELTYLVHGAREMLAAVEDADRTNEPQPIACIRNHNGAAPAPPEERAMYRWRTGHHVFALLAQFGCHHLGLALRHIESAREVDTALVDELGRSEVFIRGASAAMCYAASYCRSLYQDHVRPRMDRASGSTHGFAGVDNYDYVLLREAGERLHRAFAAREVVTVWNPDVVASARELFNAIVEDNERHTLVAAALVGTEPSLKQAREIPSSARSASGTPAVEALRQNTDERRDLLDLFTTVALIHGAQ